MICGLFIVFLIFYRIYFKKVVTTRLKSLKELPLALKTSTDSAIVFSISFLISSLNANKRQLFQPSLVLFAYSVFSGLPQLLTESHKKSARNPHRFSFSLMIAYIL